MMIITLLGRSKVKGQVNYFSDLMYFQVSCYWLHVKLFLLFFRNDLTREGALEYLTMCLKESMRMYPPVASVGRLFTKETTFDGHTMPPGTAVCKEYVFSFFSSPFLSTDTMSLLFIYALHHNPAVWENPEVINGHVYIIF